MIRSATFFGPCAIALILSGCADPQVAGSAPTSASDEDGAACYTTQTLPAVVETSTEQVLVSPAVLAADGSVQEPAVHQTKTRQNIVQERRETRFETPCPAQMTPQFWASLQRALKARGFYDAPVTGTQDAATQRAIADYQTTLNLPSSVLSMDAARQLGLIAYPR